LDDEDFRYVYGVGRIAQVGASETHYYLSDGLGSTMALTDEAGDVVNDYDYDVFGGLRDSSGSQANDFTFAGEQVDGSTGLQYLRARYYDMATGRFLSRDPLSALPNITLNPYVYANNNSALYVDPEGLFFKPLKKTVSSGIKAVSDGISKGAKVASDCLTRDDTCNLVVAAVAAGVAAGACGPAAVQCGFAAFAAVTSTKNAVQCVTQNSNSACASLAVDAALIGVGAFGKLGTVVAGAYYSKIPREAALQMLSSYSADLCLRYCDKLWTISGTVLTIKEIAHLLGISEAEASVIFGEAFGSKE
jgi:RHS repeat-associated protein